MKQRVMHRESIPCLPGLDPLISLLRPAPPLLPCPPPSPHSQAHASPRWLQDLTGSLRKNKEAHDKFVQMATVTSDGKPAVRTVVFRGFVAQLGDKTSDPGNRETLSFITDARSSKMSESRDAEVCWYLTGTREQFRLSGVLDMVTHESEPGPKELRARKWESISASARKQFLWPHPGRKRAMNGAEEDRRLFEDVSPSETDSPDAFALALLRPTRVDHLKLRGSPQQRTMYVREGDAWTEEEVNP